jgi:DNA polymerase-3 subunit gamma/tau
MAYQPLALKYRPQRFADVVGQEVATTTLRNALAGGRISHAYLFSGMRGVGKTTAARIMAKCLNCHSFDAPTTEPCDQCASCREIMASRSIDVLEIDGASNTSVDDVRALQENLLYSPARDRYKVYIVDEVHMLSKSAFNAFLKTLEEPPAHVVFIFATTEIHKIPATVLSRCMLFDFGRVSGEAIANRLRAICAAEKIEAEDAAVDLIVFGSEGSIRDAVGALDQVVNFAGDKIAYSDVLKALGLIDRDVLSRFADAVIDQDAEEAFRVVRQMADTGADMRLFCRQLIRHVRDLLVTRSGADGADLLPYSDKERELLREQAKRVSEEDMSRFFDILVRADEEMQLAGTPQYHLEAAAVKMIHSTRLTPLTEIIARVQSGELSAPAARPAPPPPIEQRLEFDEKPAPKTSTGRSADPRERLLGAVRGTTIHRYLDMAEDIRLEAGKLRISVPFESAMRNLANGENRQRLNAAARELFGEEVRVELVGGAASEEAAQAGAPAEGPPLPEEPPFAPDGETPPVDENIPAKSVDLEGAPADIERKVRRDPLAGKLIQELELSFEKVHDDGADEEDNK